MLLDRQYVPRVSELAADLKHLRRLIVLGEAGGTAEVPFEIISMDDFLAAGGPAGELIEPAPWDVAAVLFTSGTTGPSKAVRMPWAQLHATATGSMPLADLGPEDVFFNAGPTYHLGAKSFPFTAALVGGRHIMRPFPSLAKQPEEYRKHGVTTCFFPPMQWLDEPERPDDADCALRNLLLPLPIPRMDEFKRRFGCRTYSVYSMTELSCPIADTDWNIGRINSGGLFSCGVVRQGYPGYEARIVDEWDQPVEPGVVGELIVRTSAPWTVNAGYLNNPEATAAAWRNGWFHTADAFSRDEDGYFYFRDRIKDCIRRRAENISSFEVESYARKNPHVADCAAVAHKLGAEAGADEEIRLFVVPAAGADLSPEVLALWLIPRMPRFMVPRFIEFVDALPQTPTMKVQKAVLRARPLAASAWDRERAGVEVPR
jgi:crotonobetaine/carnitine-CoA ligase